MKRTTIHRDAILRTDLLSFFQKAFHELHPGTPFYNNWHLEKVAYALDRVLRGECTRLIINLPPRSGKSLIGSVVFPAFALGKNPHLKIICASYSQQLADNFSSDFRRLRQADWYRRLYRPRAPVKDTDAEYQTAEGGFRYATSVGGTLTGRGGNIIIIDDPLNAVEAWSKASRDRAKSWCTGSLLPRLDDKKTGAIILIAQRLHQDDLTGYLLEQGGWELLNLPAIAPADLEVDLFNGRKYKWRAGDPLQLAREPLTVLDSLKRQIGSDNFNAQYLQAPVPETGNMIKRTWLRTYDVVTVKPGSDQIVQSWDTAQKPSDTSSYSVCLTFLVRNKNQYYLLDVYRDRPEFPDLVKRVISHAKAFQAGAILIENKGSGISLIQTVKRNGLQGVVEIDPTMDKECRMHGQTPKLEQGSLHIPESAPWRADLLTEWLAFPKGRTNDQIDALSQFLEWQGHRQGDFEFDIDLGCDVTGALSPQMMLLALQRR